MFTLNIATRILVILTGIAILSGYSFFQTLENPLRTVFGIITILYGLYRIVSYLRARNQHEE